MSASALIVTTVTPYPPDNGKRVVLAGLVRYLVDRLGGERVHYGLVAGPDEQLPALPCEVHRLDKPNAMAQLWHAGHGVVNRRGHSLQETMLASGRLSRQIAKLVDTVRPAIEIYDTIRFGQHSPHTARDALRVLYLDDLFSVRYARMLDVMAHSVVDVDPLGEFSANIPPPLRGVVRRRAVHRPLLRFERGRIHAREKQIVHEFDMSLLVNHEEVRSLRERSGCRDVRMVTPLVAAPELVLRQPASPPEFVFLGRLNIPHNDDAICAFLTTCAPEMIRRWPDIGLRVVGKGPSENLRRLAAAHPRNVSLEGFLPNIDELFSRASGLIAPLRFGSGVKIKVLEALARSVPVVGTTTALEGIPVERNGASGCLVSDDLAHWPALLSRLMLGDSNARYSAAARAFFQRVYAQDAVYAQYDDLFKLAGDRAYDGSTASA